MYLLKNKKSSHRNLSHAELFFWVSKSSSYSTYKYILQIFNFQHYQLCHLKTKDGCNHYLLVGNLSIFIYSPMSNFCPLSSDCHFFLMVFFSFFIFLPRRISLTQLQQDKTVLILGICIC